jgi:hypothetical protein
LVTVGVTDIEKLRLGLWRRKRVLVRVRYHPSGLRPVGALGARRYFDTLICSGAVGLRVHREPEKVTLGVM